jgi:hypothetical protein
MTGEPNLPALQFGFSNARTLQDKLGIPAIVFGLVQTAVLFAIYRAILRRERAQQAQHDRHRAESAGGAGAAAATSH